MPTLLTHLIAAAVAAATAFYAAWAIQAGNLAQLELDHAKQVIEAKEKSDAIWQGLVARANEATAAAVGREVSTRNRLNDSRNELDGLRGDIAEATARLAASSPQACLNRAAALSSVLDQCAGTLQNLAGKAERHANDLKTYIDGWPTTKAP